MKGGDQRVGWYVDRCHGVKTAGWTSVCISR